MASCPHCDNGVIYTDCSTCGGTGQVFGYDDDGQETQVACHTCGGSTTVSTTCPACHGTGEV